MKPNHGNDEALRALYARHARASDVNACPPAETIVALIERTGTEEQRLETLDHVMDCALCKPEFELLRASTTLARQDTRRRVLRTQLPLALAATLVLALGATALWRAINPPPPALRGAAARALTLVAPSADARLERQDELRFVWRTAPQATSYRFELLDGAGAVLRAENTRDTALVLSAALRASLVRAAQWRVEALRVDGSRISSEWRRLIITP
jgi:hypothetical protein